MSHNDSRLDDLSREHDRIRAAADRVRCLLADGDLPGARAGWGPLAEMLEVHMAAEEGGVFALLEPVPEFSVSVSRLREEHGAMREAIRQASAAGEDPSWAETVTRLLDRFALHEVEEDEDLFRAAEVVLPAPLPAADERGGRWPQVPLEAAFPAVAGATFPWASAPLK